MEITAYYFLTTNYAISIFCSLVIISAGRQQLTHYKTMSCYKTITTFNKLPKQIEATRLYKIHSVTSIPHLLAETFDCLSSSTRYFLALLHKRLIEKQ